MQYLVTGASGGIGAALVEQLLNSPPAVATANGALPAATPLTVHATWHKHPPQLNHPNLQWHQLDVSSEEQVQALAERLLPSMTAVPLHWLVNAVGVLHTESLQPEKNIAAVSAQAVAESVGVNCTPSLLLAKHFAAHLKLSPAAVFAAVSAKVGSIEDNRLGGWYSYRLSKAALNMALKTLSIEWRRTHPNVCVASLHPGTTDTGLSQPFHRNIPASQLFSPPMTADYLYGLMSKLDSSQTGRFWAFDGEELPW